MTGRLSPEELACMAGLECSEREAREFYQRMLPILVLMAFPFPRGEVVVTARPGLRVRERPSRAARVVGSLPAAARVEVWGQTVRGDWLLVGDPCGWVAAEYVAWVG